MHMLETKILSRLVDGEIEIKANSSKLELEIGLSLAIRALEVIHTLQALCGTKPYPENIKAKKYKLHENFFTKNEFFNIMKNLPEEVRKDM